MYGEGMSRGGGRFAPSGTGGMRGTPPHGIEYWLLKVFELAPHILLVTDIATVDAGHICFEKHAAIPNVRPFVSEEPRPLLDRVGVSHAE